MDTAHFFYTDSEPQMSLAEMILKDDASITEIAAWLDAQSHDVRLEAAMSLGKKEQSRLWQLAEASAPLSLDYFVPPNVSDLTQVTHHGRNTLPVFKRFQKPMCRPAGESDRLFGYNEGSTRKFIGPGFFVAHATAGNPEWEARGAVVVNYFKVPDADVAPGWPKVKPNTSGLQTFVYNKTRDFMRRVSAHVTIGEAFREEKSMNSWFVLCRED